MTTIVVPGTERATLVTWDITNYLNDTNFNENAQVMYQYDQDGKEKASYVYGEADSRISGDLTKEAVKYTEQKAGDYSYLYDGQGNVTNTVRNGSVAESYSYDPFGEMTAEGKEGTAKTPLEAQNDNGLSDNDVLWGYNGEEYIEEVGLQYLRQRHYSPETGNFTSQDTNEGDLTNPLSQNRYIYAENDPVNGNDPGGDKKKSKKRSTKKTSKKSSKSSSKSSKKTSKKTNKKTTSKKSPSKKKSSSKKSSSKKSGSKWNKFKSYVKGRYTATKKGIKKGYRILKDKATALKKSVTCKAKQAKSFAKKQIRNAKAQISKAKHTLKTKATNAITYVKNNPGKLAKSALKGMGKALSGIPGVKQISMALGATKAVQGLKEKLYAWADKIKTGFTPSTSMKMQMEQNYTAYLQNNSSYKSSKEYQDAFKNKSLRNDLEIIEAQANIALIFSGGDFSTGKLSNKGSVKNISENMWGMSENGMNINGRRYTKHALERMAPDTPEVRAELNSRAMKKAKELGYAPGSKRYMDFVKGYVKPRNIPPSVVEDTIKHGKRNPGNQPGTWEYVGEDVRVIVNDQGDVITVIEK